jgi:3-deoxy-manno-octulosonate cytidylyltransferase (CMP-KDO synthetase)
LLDRSNCEKTTIMQIKNEQILTLIPARMQATRLPGKPMLEIEGKPMIWHVWQQAVRAELGPVCVATDSAEIAAYITDSGGRAILTDPALPSGSDRIYQALQHSQEFADTEMVINLQGDLPELDPALLHKLAEILAEHRWDLTTLVAPMSVAEAQKPQVVKAVISFPEGIEKTGRALYFSRAAVPDGKADFYHHIGVYGWRVSALKKFVSLPPSPLEQSEKLEQLRALEAGMSIGVGVVDNAPGGVDTQEDLDAVRERWTQSA